MMEEQTKGEESKNENEKEKEKGNNNDNNIISVNVQEYIFNNATKLNLRFKNLSVIDPTVCTITSLTSLDLSNNRIAVLPYEIQYLVNLKELILDENRIKLMPAIGCLHNLEKLYLRNNSIITLPKEISSLTKLKELYLARNMLESEQIEKLQTLSSLKELDLQDNKLVGMPDCLKTLDKLDYLRINRNRIEDKHLKQQNGEDTSHVEAKIVQLSLDHNILSNSTAFLVINENNQPIYNSMGKREDSIFDRQYSNKGNNGSIMMVEGKPCRILETSYAKTGKHGSAKALIVVMDKDGKKKEILVSAKEVMRKRKDVASSSAKPATPSLPQDATLNKIMMHQKAVGNFDCKVLEDIGSLTIETLREKIPEEIKSLDSSIIDQLLITAFVCGTLRTKYSGYIEQWQLVERKAQKWLIKNSSSISTIINWPIVSLYLVNNK